MKSFTVLAVLMVLGAKAYAGENEGAARAQFDEGNAAYNLGRFDESAVRYQAAYQLGRDPEVLFYLGRSYSVGGRHEQALSVFYSYLREAPANAANRPMAERIVEELKRKVDANKAAAAKAGQPMDGNPAVWPAPGPAPMPAPAPAPAYAPVPAPTPAPAPAPAYAPAPVPAYAPVPAPGPMPVAPTPEPGYAPTPPPPPQPLFAPGPQPWAAPAPAAEPTAGLLVQPNPPAPDGTAGEQPFYKTWWFWTGVGAVVAAGAVTAFLLTRKTPNACDGVGMDCVRVK
jgi:hypothetical protein